MSTLTRIAAAARLMCGNEHKGCSLGDISGVPILSKRMNGDGYALTRWFWAMRCAVAAPIETFRGLETRKAGEADAAGSGYNPGDAADHELVELRSRL